MTQELNPYAPPETTDTELPSQAVDDEDVTIYMAATPAKVVVLTLATFGIYELYWFFRQWKAVKVRTRTNISPFWRAWFSIFFVHRLFVQMRMDTSSAEVRAAGGSPGALGTLYIVSVIVGYILGRLDVGLLWVFSFVTVVPLVMMQGEINRYLRKKARGALRVAGFGAPSIIVTLLGSTWWALIIWGMVVGEK